MKAKAPTGQCLTVLKALRVHGWRCQAWDLNHLGMLNERARISDLRHRWGIEIAAETVRVEGQQQTTYVVAAHSQERACQLIATAREIMAE